MTSGAKGDLLQEESKRAKHNLELTKYDFEMPATLEDDEIAAIHVKADELTAGLGTRRDRCLRSAACSMMDHE